MTFTCLRLVLTCVYFFVTWLFVLSESFRVYFYTFSFIRVICASRCFRIFMNNAKSNILWILVCSRSHVGIDSSVLPSPASPGERFGISVRYINVCLLLFTLYTMFFSEFSHFLLQKKEKEIPVFFGASSFVLFCLSVFVYPLLSLFLLYSSCCINMFSGFLPPCYARVKRVYL